MKIETAIAKDQQDVKLITKDGVHLVFRRFGNGYLGSGIMGNIVNHKRIKVSASDVKVSDNVYDLPQITNWGEVVFAVKQKQKLRKNK